MIKVYLRKMQCGLIATVQSDRPDLMEYGEDLLDQDDLDRPMAHLQFFPEVFPVVLPVGDVITDGPLSPWQYAKMGISPQDREYLIGFLRKLLNDLEGLEQATIEDKLQEVGQ